MKILSVSELKATLSEQLVHVRRGEVIVVTNRGCPVARLVPVERDEMAEGDLLRLESAGLARRGTGRLPPAFWRMKRPDDPQGEIRASITAERESSW